MVALTQLLEPVQGHVEQAGIVSAMSAMTAQLTAQLALPRLSAVLANTSTESTITSIVQIASSTVRQEPMLIAHLLLVWIALLLVPLARAPVLIASLAPQEV